MLRRTPTTITLTTADIEQYEANRQRKLWEAQQAQASPQSSTVGSDKGKEKDPNDELKPFPKEKSKKDRIMGSGR
jgi:hypothetical protein